MNILNRTTNSICRRNIHYWFWVEKSSITALRQTNIHVYIRARLHTNTRKQKRIGIVNEWKHLGNVAYCNFRKKFKHPFTFRLFVAWCIIILVFDLPFYLHSYPLAVKRNSAIREKPRDRKRERKKTSTFVTWLISRRQSKKKKRNIRHTWKCSLAIYILHFVK